MAVNKKQKRLSSWIAIAKHTENQWACCVILHILVSTSRIRLIRYETRMDKFNLSAMNGEQNLDEIDIISFRTSANRKAKVKIFQTLILSRR